MNNHATKWVYPSNKNSSWFDEGVPGQSVIKQGEFTCFIHNHMVYVLQARSHHKVNYCFINLNDLFSINPTVLFSAHNWLTPIKAALAAGREVYTFADFGKFLIHYQDMECT